MTDAVMGNAAEVRQFRSVRIDGSLFFGKSRRPKADNIGELVFSGEGRLSFMPVVVRQLRRRSWRRFGLNKDALCAQAAAHAGHFSRFCA